MKPFVKHECAISSPRPRVKEEKAVSQRKVRKVENVKAQHKILLVRNLVEITKEPNGQWKKNPQKHIVSQSKDRLLNLLYSAGAVGRLIIIKTIHNKLEMKL